MEENALFITNSNTGDAFCLATSMDGAWSIGGDFSQSDFSKWMSRQDNPKLVSVITEVNILYTINCPVCGEVVHLEAIRPGSFDLHYSCESCGDSKEVHIEDEDPEAEAFRSN
jgi:predicted RNA-binding Zn-ribbon protein involved in translation (DUF1610 family)